jgi:hypothetical protein
LKSRRNKIKEPELASVVLQPPDNRGKHANLSLIRWDPVTKHQCCSHKRMVHRRFVTELCRKTEKIERRNWKRPELYLL